MMCARSLHRYDPARKSRVWSFDLLLSWWTLYDFATKAITQYSNGWTQWQRKRLQSKSYQHRHGQRTNRKRNPGLHVFSSCPSVVCQLSLLGPVWTYTNKRVSKHCYFVIYLTHFVLQTRISCFEHDFASARKWETLVLDQYFRFGVPSVEVTAPS